MQGRVSQTGDESAGVKFQVASFGPIGANIAAQQAACEKAVILDGAAKRHGVCIVVFKTEALAVRAAGPWPQFRSRTAGTCNKSEPGCRARQIEPQPITMATKT